MKMSDLRRLVEEGETRTVYHITNTENLPSIMKNGIEPRLGHHSMDIGEPTAGVHVFLNWDTVEDAMMNWETMSWHDEDAELSVLTLEVPKDIVEYSPMLIGGTGIIYEKVPPSTIKNVSEIY